MTFDLTNLTNASDFVGLFKFANEVTDNIFVYLILFAIFMVMLGTGMRYSKIEKAFVAASFTTMILSWLFFAIGLIGIEITFVLLVLTLIGAFIVGRGREE